MHVQHMLRKTGLSNQFIATVGRSNLSLCDRQKALGMIDNETNTCEDATQ